jgi:hypothetical protein
LGDLLFDVARQIGGDLVARLRPAGDVILAR